MKKEIAFTVILVLVASVIEFISGGPRTGGGTLFLLATLCTHFAKEEWREAKP